MAILSGALTLALGFAISGATASAYEAATGKRASFALLRAPDLAAVAAVVTLGAAYLVARALVFGAGRPRKASFAFAGTLEQNHLNPGRPTRIEVMNLLALCMLEQVRNRRTCSRLRPLEPRHRRRRPVRLRLTAAPGDQETSTARWAFAGTRKRLVSTV